MIYENDMAGRISYSVEAKDGVELAEFGSAEEAATFAESMGLQYDVVRRRQYIY